MKVRVATCLTLPEVDVDAEPLRQALGRGGFDPQWLAWDDPSVDWDAPGATIIRSTWNYSLHVDAFVEWIERVSKAGPLFNPAEVITTNCFKRYLLELAQRGVPVVPTTVVERGASSDEVLAALAELEAARFVVKPEVGGGSLGTKVFTDGEHAEARAHLTDLVTRGAALVQPYLASVEDYGERSLVYIDGELSHAIRKAPRFAGDAESITGPFPIADDERDVAEAALAPYGALLYGRVDLARDPGGIPRIMELELVEPSLFFAHEPGSADRYVAGLRNRLQTR